ncbi:hypothetical protein KSW10_003155 [Vibrio parahaemolyticus]|nr:hypothetical protein [Vibrio parahaemolyticus]
MEIGIEFQSELLQMLKSTVTKNWYESPLALVVFSSGMTILGAIVTHCFNTRSEAKRIKAEQDLKTIELENIKKEKIHQDQVNSLKAYSKIYHDFRPIVWSSPDMDSYEAFSRVVEQMGDFLIELNMFIKEYRFILPAVIVDRLESVVFLLNEHHWGATMADTHEYIAKPEEIEAAEQAIQQLEDIEKEFKTLLSI